MSSGTVWDNEKVLEFLELYQAEPVLWNPMVREHKNRNAIADAWQRLQASLSVDCSVTELKKKRESLMSTYRLYNKKIRDSIRSGVSTDHIYKTTWFAYELMDSFLGAVYNKKSNSSTINTEAATLFDLSEGPEMSSEESEMQSSSVLNNTVLQATTSTPASKRRATTTSDVAHARKQMDEAVSVLKTISSRSSSDTSEVDLFCKLLAAKIKKFGQEQREDIMHEIDELMYNKRRKENRHNMNTRPLSGTSTLLSSPLTISVPSPSPSTYSQSQFPVLSYVETQPPYSQIIYNGNEECSGGGRPTTQNAVEIISNGIIQESVEMTY